MYRRVISYLVKHRQYKLKFNLKLDMSPTLYNATRYLRHRLTFSWPTRTPLRAKPPIMNTTNQYFNRVEFYKRHVDDIFYVLKARQDRRNWRQTIRARCINLLNLSWKPKNKRYKLFGGVIIRQGGGIESANIMNRLSLT